MIEEPGGLQSMGWQELDTTEGLCMHTWGAMAISALGDGLRFLWSSLIFLPGPHNHQRYSNNNNSSTHLLKIYHVPGSTAITYISFNSHSAPRGKIKEKSSSSHVTNIILTIKLTHFHWSLVGKEKDIEESEAMTAPARVNSYTELTKRRKETSKFLIPQADPSRKCR